MSKLRLSIVIPVYNLENYIAETLDSCLAQDISEEEYEIICIDDGSTDGSLNVLNCYAQIHSNVIVCSKENRGVSSARNVGIELAQGQYIWFVDGDDLIAENALGMMLFYAEESTVDLLKFDMYRTSCRTTYAAKYPQSWDTCENPVDIPSFMTMKGGAHGGICTQWFRRDLLIDNNIRFLEHLHYSEDVLFGFRAALCSKRAAKTDSVLYYYYQRPDSAMHSKNHRKHAESMHLLAKEYDKMAEEYKNSSFLKAIESKRAYAVKGMIFSLIQQGDIELLREKLDMVTKEGLYPFPFLLESLRNNQTWKQVFINYVSFLFPCRWYVMLCVRLMALKRSR